MQIKAFCLLIFYLPDFVLREAFVILSSKKEKCKKSLFDHPVLP